MVRRRTIVAASVLGLLSACDSNGPGGEDAATAAPDAAQPVRCGPATPFGAPSRILELEAPMRVTGPSLTPDELTIVFSRQATTFPADRNYDLYIATRMSANEPFGAPIAIVAANSQNTDANVQIASDGMTIYFDADGPQVFYATRGSVNDEFGPAYVLPDLYTEGINATPFVTADAEEIWFSAMRPPNPANWDVYRATSTGSGYGNVVPEASLSSASYDQLPVLSADELTIYLASGRPGGMGQNDIWRSTRSATTESFPPPTLVPDLSSPGDDVPGWLSPDGCRFYLASTRDGLLNLYVAARAP